RPRLASRGGFDRAPHPRPAVREFDVLDPAPGDQDRPDGREEVLALLDLADEIVRERDALPEEQSVARVGHHALVQLPDGGELALRNLDETGHWLSEPRGGL